MADASSHDADTPDMDDAVHSGDPPAVAPFFLDPGYDGTLESGEFRRRFVKLVAMPRNIPAYGCFALFFLTIYCGVPLAVLAFSFSFTAFLSWCAALIIPLLFAVFFGWVWSKGWRYERRLRRLGRKGALVQGTIVAAQRVRQVIPGSDFSEGDDSYTIVAVEVKYRAIAPDGQPIDGVGTLRRDDLLNADLPRPGTPAWILVLDPDTHAIL